MTNYILVYYCNIVSAFSIGW